LRAGGRTGRTYWQADGCGGATEGGWKEAVAEGREVGPRVSVRERESERAREGEGEGEGGERASERASARERGE